MKIKIASLHIDHTGGGSGSWTAVMAEALRQLGHEVDVMKSVINKSWYVEDYDLIITSHQTSIRSFMGHGAMPGWERTKHIHVLHGIYPGEEQPLPIHGKFVSVSEEVQEHARKLGFESTVIRQPIVLHPGHPLRTENPKWLFIKNAASTIDLSHLGVTTIDPSRPVIDQILEHDVVIGIGRSALEGMACGRMVVIADDRSYQGPITDGIANEPCELEKSMRCNYSGRACRYPFDINDLPSTIKNLGGEYPSLLSQMFYDHVAKHHEAKMIAQQFLDLIKDQK